LNYHSDPRNQKEKSMQYRIRRISPHSAGKISAVVSGCFSLLLWPIFLMAAVAGKSAGQNPFPGIANLVFLILPVLYAVMGYVMTALACLLYNFLSKYVGPLVMEMDVEPDAPALS
jgi:hypothetical protein